MKKLLLGYFFICFIFPLISFGAVRDPFTPLATKWSGFRDKPILQQYELSQLQIAGIILGGESPRILFEDPTGRSYIVTPQNRIGKKQGTITKVEKTSVVIQEDVQKPDGSKESHSITMRLRR